MTPSVVSATQSHPSSSIPRRPPPGLALRFGALVKRLRRDIGQRIAAALPGEPGAIANALITGERGGIEPATIDAFRDSGLLHVLAISGLHMAIMAGSVFFAVRWLLALWPTVALRWPIKKWAAVAAAIAAIGYLTISGTSSATIRSAIMVLVMFLAILLDRPAVTLRNVAIAALCILLVAPESLLQVGFQMSFAAVVALVSAYEALRRRSERREQTRGFGLLTKIWMFFAGIVLSTLVASLAVAPIAAFHFHKGQLFAIAANLIAIPVVNVVVMPAALASLVVMPLGLEALPLWIMGHGIEAMTWAARTVSGLPGAMTHIPAIPLHAFVLILVGGLWLALWQQRWRLIGLVWIGLGLALSPFLSRADVLVGRDGALVAVRDGNGQLSALSGRGREYELARWLQYDGDGRPPEEAAAGNGFRCDAVGCTARINGVLVAMPSHPAAHVDDCAKADLLILRWPHPRECRTKATVIDYFDVRDHGVHAIEIEDGKMHVVNVAATRGERPWTTPAPKSRGRPRTEATPTSRLAAFSPQHDLVENPADVRPEIEDEASWGR